MPCNFVGPMPFADFLKKFMPPPSEAGECVFSDENKAKFEMMASQRKHIERYNLLIDALQPFLNSFVLEAKSQSPNHNSDVLTDRAHKPSIMLYPPGDPSLPKTIFNSEVVFEVKLSSNDDPFEDKLTSTFIKSSEEDIDTLGQLSPYTVTQFDLQFRVHAFSILVIKNYARIIYWDRAGSVVTEMLPLTERYLAEFMWRYTLSTPDVRGFDTTVTPATEEEAAEAEAELKEYESPSTEFLKFLVRDDLLPDESYYYIGRRPVLKHKYDSSIAGRATRSFIVWDPKEKRVVFMKDTWRIEGIDKEGQIYAELHAAHVEHIAPFERAGDLNHRTLAQECVGEAWARLGTKRPFRTHQHYRLALGVVGRDLESFKSTKELVTAVRDAIVAHGQIYERVKILHGDISVGNIMILPNGRGILIDFDLCKRLSSLDASWVPGRTGTWRYMSVRLQQGETPLRPTLADDIESFLHVLIWLALLYTHNKFTPAQLSEQLDRIFDDAYVTNGFMTGGMSKRYFLKAVGTDTCGFKDGPLLRLLRDLMKTCASRYQNITLPESPIFDADNPIDETELLLFQCYQREYHLQILLQERLNSSSWIIDFFNKFLKCTDWPENDKAMKNELAPAIFTHPTRVKTRTQDSDSPGSTSPGPEEGGDSGEGNPVPSGASQADPFPRPRLIAKRSRVEDEPPSPSKKRQCLANRINTQSNP